MPFNASGLDRWSHRRHSHHLWALHGQPRVMKVSVTDVRLVVGCFRCLAAALLSLLMASQTVTPARGMPVEGHAQRLDAASFKVVSRATTRLITLRSELTVPNSPLSLMGGPRFGERLPSTVWGYAISRVTTRSVVAGRVRLALLENELEVFATPSIGPGQRVRPGTYLLTTFGPSRPIIRSLNLPHRTQLGRPVRQSYNYFSSFLSQAGTELHPTASVNYLNTAKTFTFFGLAGRTNVQLNYSSSFACLVEPTVDTCAEKIVAREALGLLPVIGEGGVATAFTQPGVVPIGTHKQLFEATTGSVGAQVAGFWLALRTRSLGGQEPSTNVAKEQQ